MVDPIKLPIPTPPPNADAHARADTERNQRLFEWAEGLLEALGLDKTIAAARSIEDLRRIALDVDSAEIALALRDALHPASGQRQEHFRGLREGSLKAILRNRFAEWKKDREATLRQSNPPKSDWTKQLILDKDGRIRPLLANLILILQEAPKWLGVLGYDEFNARVAIRRRPPWGTESPGSPWTDHHDSLARVWFQTEGINPAAGDVGRAVQAAARHNAFHPVRDYFGALVWDGVPRLDAWLVTYFHVEDSPYVRAIGPRYLISSVARIYRPGCKVDHTLVLEGPQGKQKSEALRTLAVNDAWFTDRLSHVSSKDAAQEMAGVLIIELAELDALTRATASATKSFLTRRHDRYRPPFGKHLTTLPRQCIFSGSINPPDDGRYLRDETGARRLWPVACRGMVDLAGLEVARDQLWAEAVHRFKAGAKWHLETPELEALATAEQALRLVVDPWTDSIREWVGDRTDVSVKEVLQHVFGIAAGPGTHAAEIRVAKILKKNLGFTKVRSRSKGERENRYQREPVAAEDGLLKL